MTNDKAKKYWQKNLRYLVVLLTIWFTVSFGAGILFREVLDQIKIGGFPLGFGLHNKGLFMYLLS